MSSRPQFNPYPAIKNGNMATSLTSDITIIQKLSEISYSYNWVGTSPAGTVVVEVSNDYSQNGDGTTKNPGTWNIAPLSAATNVTGSTGDGFIDLVGIAAYAIRTRYTPTSGSGILNVVVNAKVA